MEATINTETRITMEPEQSNYWVDLAKWVIAWVTGALGTAWTCNTAIHKYFEWKKNQQQQFIEEVIDKKMAPTMERIESSVDELKEEFWKIKLEISKLSQK